MSEERTIAGRYRLLEHVGSGAMGTVSRAFDQTLRRTVAVKEVHVPGGLTGQQNDELVRRTMREGRIAARLHHPQLITVYDVVEDGGRPYLIMEHFPSRSLKALGTLPWAAAAWIGAQAAEALASAHASGVVHRDIKPANILVGDDAAVKITDFGVSRVVEDLTATMTGMFAGTPAYLAPEVAKGGRATFASDVYSLGATLYSVIEGVSPAGDSANPMGVLYRVASGEINKPKQAGPLTDVLMWLLNSDPGARPTMAQAAKALAANATKPTLAAVPLPLPANSGAVQPDVATEPAATDSTPATESAPSVEPAAEPGPVEPAAESDAESESVPNPPASEWQSVAPLAEEEPTVSETGSSAANESDSELTQKSDSTPKSESTESDSNADSATDVGVPAAGLAATSAGPSSATAADAPSPTYSSSTAAPSSPATPSFAAAAAGSAPVPPQSSNKSRAGRARAIGIAAGLIVVAVVAAVVTTLLNNDDKPDPNPVAQPDKTTSKATTTTDEPEPTTATTTQKPTTATTTPPPAQQPPQQAASPAAAITDYYALMPGNLDQAWTRLSPRFQNGHAGGRSGYANWWGKISSVQVSEVTQTGANTVEATVLYNFKDGHNTLERHLYTFVNVNGAWLIDAQDVLSTRTV